MGERKFSHEKANHHRPGPRRDCSHALFGSGKRRGKCPVAEIYNQGQTKSAEEAAAKEEKDKEAALAVKKQKKSFPTSLCGNAIRAAAKRHEKRLREKA